MGSISKNRKKERDMQTGIAINNYEKSILSLW